MSASHLTPMSLYGLSFGIADLLLLRAWAEAQGLRMSVHLDHAIENEEYEEVLAFSKAGSPFCRWLMWRDARTVFVQPLIGRRQGYRCVAEFVDILTPSRAIELTDIVASAWPSR